MSKLQLIDAKNMEKLLFKLGFEKQRQRGIEKTGTHS